MPASKLEYWGQLYTGRGDWGAFMNKLQSSMGKIAPWQAKFLLQWFFKQNPFSGSETLGKMLSGKDDMAKKLRGMIGDLSGIAAGTKKSEGQAPIRGMETRLDVPGEGVKMLGVQRAKTYTGQETPPGFAGLMKHMFPRPGSMQNPYGSRTGLLKAVFSGDLFSPSIKVGPSQKQIITHGTADHPVKSIMARWGLETPEEWDATAGAMWATGEEEHRRNVQKAKEEWKAKGLGRGTSPLGSMLEKLGPKLAGMALGGTLFAAGGELAAAAGPGSAATGAKIAGGLDQGIPELGMASSLDIGDAVAGVGGPKYPLLYGLGDVAQSYGAEMFESGAGYAPKTWGMPGQTKLWEGPRTGAGRAASGMGRILRGQPEVPLYDPEEERRKKEERRRLEELMAPYQWDEESWRFMPRTSRWWGY